MKRALTIAGSDSGGGAGIQADLKTFMAFGVHGMSAITALTAQNTVGVQGIFDISPEFVREQIKSVMTDIGANDAKTGMLSNAASVKRVTQAAREIDKMGCRWVVVKGGDLDIGSRAIDVLYDGSDFLLLESPRLESENTHGTGCTFAPPLAAGLAQGLF